MQLERCKDQASRTLEQFYSSMIPEVPPAIRAGPEAMLDLIARLRATPRELTIWGLTSHMRLCLLAENTAASPWYVIVSALDHENYYVEYLMPPELAPWPGARVQGEARSIEQAMQMIMIAMDNCRGWTEK